MTSESARAPRAGLVLAGLVLLAVLGRIATFHEPLEFDISNHLLIAQGLLEGRPLYTDLWNHKPPGTYLAFAPFVFVFGPSPTAAFAVSSACAAISILAIHALARALGLGTLPALLGAATLALLSLSQPLQANQPNSEVVMNALLLGGAALLVQAERGEPADRPRALFRATAAGLCFALASLVKPMVALLPVLLGAAHMALPAKTGSRKHALSTTAAAGAVGIAVWGAFLGYMAATGRLEELYVANVTYNKHYGGDMGASARAALSLARLLPSCALVLAAPLSLGMLSIAGGVLGGLGRSAAHLAAQLVAAYVAIALPGQWFAHYYQLLIPGAALGTALAAELAWRSSARLARGLAVVTQGAAPAVLCVTAALVLPGLATEPDQVSLQKYGPAFIAARDLGRTIGRILRPDEQIFVLGNSTGVYLYAEKRPPTGILFSSPLLSGPAAETLTRRVIADLERERPSLAVLNAYLVEEQGAHPVIAWISSRYRPVAGIGEPTWARLFVLRGSDLDDRL